MIAAWSKLFDTTVLLTVRCLWKSLIGKHWVVCGWNGVRTCNTCVRGIYVNIVIVLTLSSVENLCRSRSYQSAILDRKRLWEWWLSATLPI